MIAPKAPTAIAPKTPSPRTSNTAASVRVAGRSNRSNAQRATRTRFMYLEMHAKLSGKTKTIEKAVFRSRQRGSDSPISRHVMPICRLPNAISYAFSVTMHGPWLQSINGSLFAVASSQTFNHSKHDSLTVNLCKQRQCAGRIPRAISSYGYLRQAKTRLPQHVRPIHHLCKLRDDHATLLCWCSHIIRPRCECHP